MTSQRRARSVLAAFLVLPVLAVTACSDGADDEATAKSAVELTTPPATSRPTTPPLTATTSAAGDARPRLARSRGGARVSTVATGLNIPWDIAFLPDGRALVTERPGRVRLLSRDRKLRRAPLARIAVSARGEGGLLGVAIDPRFGTSGNDFVYLAQCSGTCHQPQGARRLRFRDATSDARHAGRVWAEAPAATA